jgi:putative hemolysin
MPTLTLILGGIAFLILLNGLFACMEIALVSVSSTRLRRMEREGRPGASAALFLQKNIDDFFAVVQIGITFVGTLSAAIGGDAALELFTPALNALGISPASTAGKVFSLAGITIGISYVNLVIGELVPKSLARRYPGTISTFLAGFFRAFAKVMTPAVKVLSASTSLALKIIGVPEDRKTAALTKEEFGLLASELFESRQIPKAVHDIMVHALHLAQTRVEDVMTPRHRIVSVEVDSPEDPGMRDKILARYKEHPFTNFPVTSGGGERVLGVVNVKDLLFQEKKGTSLLRPTTFTARGVTLERLLPIMQQKRTKMSVVVDEHGLIDGIITLEDIIEDFVGEIEGEVVHNGPFDEPGVFGHKPPSIVVDGATSLHELRERFQISLPQSRHYSTLAGFILDRMGKIPSVGDKTDYNGLRLEVLEREGNRIKTVGVAVFDPPEDPDDDQ